MKPSCVSYDCRDMLVLWFPETSAENAAACCKVVTALIDSRVDPQSNVHAATDFKNLSMTCLAEVGPDRHGGTPQRTLSIDPALWSPHPASRMAHPYQVLNAHSFSTASVTSSFRVDTVDFVEGELLPWRH